MRTKGKTKQPNINTTREEEAKVVGGGVVLCWLWGGGCWGVGGLHVGIVETKTTDKPKINRSFERWNRNKGKRRAGSCLIGMFQQRCRLNLPKNLLGEG